MTRRSFASAEASYFFDWQVFRHCGADLLLTRLKRRQKRSTHRTTFEVVLAVVADLQVAVLFFILSHKCYFFFSANIQYILSLF